MSGLSIVVPVYNAEQYLEQCILSIKNELTECDQLVLVNDGSKDNSLDICKRYECENVLVISNENHGVSYTRNCGNDNASCDYVMYVDADDYLLPGWRQDVENGVKTGSDVVYFSPSGETEASRRDIIANILCVSGQKKLDIKGSACWYKLFSTKLIKENCIKFDSELINGEDGIFSLQCFLRSKSYTIVKAGMFYYYRINNTSATHTFNPKFNSSNIKFLQTVKCELSSYNDFNAEEIKTTVYYLTYNGLYILASRISFLDSKNERSQHYGLFESPMYLEFWNDFDNKWSHQKFKTKIINLIRDKKYDKVMSRIRLRRKIFNLAKKVLRRKNGF